eukprot:EG_transcript_4323
MDLRWGSGLEPPTHRRLFTWVTDRLIHRCSPVRRPSPMAMMAVVVPAVLAAYGLAYGAAALALGHASASVPPFGLSGAALLVELCHLSRRSMRCVSLLLGLTLVAFPLAAAWLAAEWHASCVVWALWAPQLLLHLGTPARQAWLWLLLALAALGGTVALRATLGGLEGTPDDPDPTAALLFNTLTLALHGATSLFVATLTVPPKAEPPPSPAGVPPTSSSLAHALFRPEPRLGSPRSHCSSPRSKAGGLDALGELSVRFPNGVGTMEFVTPTDGVAAAPEDPPHNGSGVLRFSFATAVPAGDCQVRCGSLLYIRLPRLEAAVGLLADNALHGVQRASTAFVAAVLAAAKHTGSTLHHLAQDECLMSWNFGPPCRLHVQSACEAAVMLRNSLNSSSDAGPEPLGPVSMGLYSGFCASTAIAHEDGLVPSVLGPGVGRARALQRYAAATGRAIVVNAEAQRRAAGMFRWRFVPVDVVATKPCAALEQLETENAPSELAYMLDTEFSMPQEEWMYQLQTVSRNETNCLALEELLLEAQRGVKDVAAYDRALTPLMEAPDSCVADVAKAFHKHLRRGALVGPYCQQWLAAWLPGHAAAAAAAALRRKERTRSVAFNVFSAGRKFSTRPSETFSSSSGTSSDLAVVRKFSTSGDSSGDSNKVVGRISQALLLAEGE